MPRATAKDPARTRAKHVAAIEAVNDNIRKLQDQLTQVEDLRQEGFPYRDAMRARAVERGATLASDATAGEARLVWTPVGAELEAQWVVRVAMTTVSGPQTYRATFTADGALAALEREEGR